MTMTVTGSRGQTAIYRTAFNALDYSVPSIHGILRRAADAWTQAEKMAITGCSLSAANTRLRSISASAPCSTCGSRRKGRKARIPTALVRKLGGRRLIWPYTNDYSVAVILSLLKSNLC